MTAPIRRGFTRMETDPELSQRLSNIGVTPVGHFGTALDELAGRHGLARRIVEDAA